MSSIPHILIVDDDPRFLELMELILSQDGYRVSAAQDGLQALQLVQGSPPDLIILDIVLPGMDGLELVDCLKTIGGDNIPFIFLSALGQPHHRLTGLGVGAARIHPQTLLTRQFTFNGQGNLIIPCSFRPKGGEMSTSDEDILIREWLKRNWNNRLMDTVSDGVYVVTLDGNILQANAIFTDLWTNLHGEWLQNLFSDQMIPEDLVTVKLGHQAMLEGSKGGRALWRLQDRSGVRRYFEGHRISHSKRKPPLGYHRHRSGTQRRKPL